jgi:hypothetical protein
MNKKYTEFNGLHLPTIEAEILAAWKAEQAFEQSVILREGKTPFVFYEGPPSANGMPGIHHVISRTLKDMVCRYKTMQGFQVKRKGGWDTHGLPVELGVEKELGITKEDIGKTITVEAYNKKCREAVLRYKKEWDDITNKMGYWVDLNNPYITFENKHFSVHANEFLRSRSIVVSSFGKTFHITGWKIGYLVAPEFIMNEIKKVHQFLVFCVNSVAQNVLAEYLPLVKTENLGGFYQEKRDFFRERMQASRFELMPCEGTYFQVASYDTISDEQDIDFTKRLVTEFGVATIPLSVFNADLKDRKMIRFCFAKDIDTLIQATERLCKI